MFKHLLKPIANEFSGQRAWLDVNRLWQFRNTVCTPSLRSACRHCVRRFRENSIQAARTVPYAADGRTRYGATVIPPEWEPKSASLSVVKPAGNARRITAFEENALSLMSRSARTPERGVETELVVLQDGSRPEDYDGIDVRGRIVMTARQGSAVARLAAEKGAIGIVSDTIDRPYPRFRERPMRESFDGPDAVQWNCLPGTGPTRNLFGFVLSPRIGQRLRDLVAQSREPVVLRAHVDARAFKGHSDVVDAVVRGKGREELWVLAHISEPGAYDNASGLAVSLEIARTLQELTQTGVLPPMARSVRFLFSTEVSGFVPYLEQYRARLPRVKAGLCLDSVGVDMSGETGGEFVIFSSPDYAASYIDDLLAEITEETVHMRADWFGENNYSMFPWRHEPFWGNDAFIIDPYFDVPTAQLSCYPFRYYHTSQDVPEHLSPDNLARTGVICAAFLYWLACAGAEDACWLSALSAARAKTRIADAVRAETWRQIGACPQNPTRKALNAAACKVRQCGLYHASVETDRVLQPLGLVPRPPAGTRRAVDALVKTVHACSAAEEQAALTLLSELAGGGNLDAEGREPLPPGAGEAQRLVPTRNAWQLPPDSDLSISVRRRLAALRNGVRNADVAAAWRWANGRRSVFEIWQQLRYIMPCDLDMLVQYFHLLAEAGAVELREHKGNQTKQGEQQ